MFGFISNWDDRENSSKTLNDLLAGLTDEEMTISKFSQRKDQRQPNELVMVASTSKGPSKSYNKSSSNKKKRTKCMICKEKLDHKMEGCPKYDPNYKSKKKDHYKFNQEKPKEQVNNDQDISIVAEKESNLSCTSTEWIVDCGATRQMTNDKSDFIEYQKLETPRVVRFSGREKGDGVGIGMVKVVANVNGR